MFRVILGLALVLLSEGACPDNTLMVDDSCFLMATDQKLTWSAAREYCQGQGGELAVIDDCNFFGNLVRTIYFYDLDDNTTEGYWIGGKDLGSENTWYWIDQTSMPMGMPFWGVTINGIDFGPQPDTEGDDCVLMKKNNRFYFHDENCEETLANPLCQFDPVQRGHGRGRWKAPTKAVEEGESKAVVDCPADFREISGHCFYFHNETSSWQDARDFCRNLNSTKADLAILDDCSLLSSIVKYIHLVGDALEDKSGYWIGATDNGDEGTWNWINYTPVSLGMPSWGSANETADEPSRSETSNCADIYENDRYYIHDHSCTTKFRALCQIF